MNENQIGGLSGTTNLLDFGLIRETIASMAHTSVGKDLVLSMVPSNSFVEVMTLQQETAEGCHLTELGAQLEFGPPDDLRNLVNRARLGGILNGLELLLLRSMVDAALRNRFVLKRHEELPLLSGISDSLPDLGIVSRSIDRAIGESGDILDQASITLQHLRMESRSTFNQLNSVVDRNLRRLERQGLLQEPIITQRNGRVVLLVKAEMKYKVPGIVHDVSDSGATVFVEPMAAIDLGNKWRESRSAEDREEQRILRELSELVGDMSDDCEQMLNAMARLDLVCAKSAYAITTKAVAPEISDPDLDNRTLRLSGARHPLLSGDVVAITLDIADTDRVMLITGPNAGGKTVSLKTIGLLVMMAQAGLHVPADEIEMPLFDGVYADIGDQQSIEHSLSTFSSHIQNLNKILNMVTGKSLVLIDELGTSTDPEEGAALAEAILSYLRDRGVLTISTTHHRRVAHYVQNQPMMINASVDLDPKTLEPTYYITSGLPGRSYAMTIAERLGLSRDIIHNARLRMSSDERDSEELLRELREGRHTVEQLRKEAEVNLLDVRAKQADVDKQLEDVESRKIEIVEEARLDLQNRISEIQQNLQRAEKFLSEAEQSRYSDEDLRERTRNEIRLLSDTKREISQPDWQPIKLDRGDWQNSLQVGDRVFVRGIPRPVEILSAVDEENNIEVLMGTMRAKIPVYQLDKPAENFIDTTDKPITAGDARYRQVSGVGVYARANKRKTPEDEINLHGQRVDEALGNVEQFLDDASLASLDTVRIVHGKGTGTLRQAIREYLDEHPVVTSWNSDPGPAGNGVTVVWLK